MTFFKLLKCALCPRWSCPARYQIGNRTYYSMGFIRTECPKKLEKDPFFKFDRQFNEELTKRQHEDLKKMMSDKDNEKNEG